ncbi:hypothetical protein JCM3770_006532 [Rhodotorula araucariae]
MNPFRPLSPKERDRFEAACSEASSSGKLGKLVSSLERGVRKYSKCGHDRKVQHRKERLYYVTHGRWEADTMEVSGDEDQEDDGYQLETISLVRGVEVLDLTQLADSDDELPSASVLASPRDPVFSSRTGRSSSTADQTAEELATSVDRHELRRSNSRGRVVLRPLSPELYGPACAPADTAPVSLFAAAKGRSEGKRTSKGKERAREATKEPAEQPVTSTSKVPNGCRSASGGPPVSPLPAPGGPPRRKRRIVSRTSSPDVASKRRRKGVEWLGNLVESQAVDLGTEGSSSGTSSDELLEVAVESKKVDKDKQKAQKEHQPVFITPHVAHTVARLFPSHMWYTDGISHAEIEATDEADEDALNKVEQRVGESGMRRPAAEARREIGAGLVLVDQGKKAHPIRSSSAVKVYKSARVDGVTYRRGQWVLTTGKECKPWFGRIVYFHDGAEETAPDLQVHLQWASTAQARLGKTAHARHLLLLDECSSSPASTIVSPADVHEGNDQTVLAPSFFFCCTYNDDKSTSPPLRFDGPTPLCDKEAVGDAVPLPWWCEEPGSLSGIFMYDGDQYHADDNVYLKASFEAQQEPHWNGAQAAFRLARLIGVKGSAVQLTPTTTLLIQPFLRLGHLKMAEERKERQLVALDEVVEISLAELVGHFRLIHGKAPKLAPLDQPDTFWVCKQIRPVDDGTRDFTTLWDHPPCLLFPPDDLGDGMRDLLVPLAESKLARCMICAEEGKRQDEEQAEIRKKVDEGFTLSGLSVYSGIDLLGMGLQRGLPLLQTKVAIESDPDVAKVCRANHPGVDVRCASVDEALKKAYLTRVKDRKVDMDADEGELGILDVDVVFGGPPCQPFSLLNRHRDPLDPRLVQIFVFLSFFDGGRPLAGLMENVSRLNNFAYARGARGNLFGAATDLAIRLGYDIRPVILNAAAFGVAQDRRRLFLCFAKRGIPVAAVPEQTHAVSTRLTGQTMRHEDEEDVAEEKVPFGRRAALQSAPHPAVALKEAIAGLPEYDASRKDEHVAGPGSLDVDGNHNDYSLVPSALFLERVRHLGERKKDDFYRRLWTEEIVGTLTTRIRPEGVDGCCIHPSRNRLLSLRECLRLQGAPDDLSLFPLVFEETEGGPTKNDVELAHKLIGNGVAVPIATALGREMAKSIAPIVLREAGRPSRNADERGTHDEPGDTVYNREPAAYFASLSRRLEAGERFDRTGASTAQAEVTSRGKGRRV